MQYPTLYTIAMSDWDLTQPLNLKKKKKSKEVKVKKKRLVKKILWEGGG